MMIMSPTIKALAEALAEAQSEIKSVTRDTKAFNYKYADLAAVREAVREPLAANGLSIVQIPCLAREGYVGLETIILHSSGEYMGQVFELPVKNPSNPQDVGSALTYARRYALMAVTQIAPEDDDGAAAAGKPGPAKPPWDAPVRAAVEKFKAASTTAAKEAAAKELRGIPGVPEEMRTTMLLKMSTELNSKKGE